MHNLKTNFDKILDITKSFFEGPLNVGDNCYHSLNFRGQAIISLLMCFGFIIWLYIVNYTWFKSMSLSSIINLGMEYG